MSRETSVFDYLNNALGIRSGPQGIPGPNVGSNTAASVVQQQPDQRLAGPGAGPIDRAPPPPTPLPPNLIVPPTADVLRNMVEASHHAVIPGPFNPGALQNAIWFYNHVKTGGNWDYKRGGRPGPILYPELVPFGNFNYGATGVAAGFPDWVLRRGAGATLFLPGGSSPEWGVPWGAAPYGDQPQDQYWIQQGIEWGHLNYGR
jgi:hypothetical protein